MLPCSEQRVKVLRVRGVIGFVGAAARQGSPILDRQIENIRALLIGLIAFDPYPFLSSEYAYAAVPWMESRDPKTA